MLSNNMYQTAADYPQFMDSFIRQKNNEYTFFKNDKRIDTKLIKNITFVVTESCNFNCSYCYEKHKTNKKMTKEVAKEAVDFLFDREKINNYFDYDNTEAIVLEFIGGEPLLEIELMDYITEYFKAKAFNAGSRWATNYMISITSNGSLYRDKKVQDYLNKNQGKVSISITIDGNKKLHDSCRVFNDGSPTYDIVEDAIKEQVRTNGLRQTKITLAPENVMYLNEALQNVFSLGITGAFTNCVYEEGWKTEHAKILYKEMVKLADFLLTDQNYKKYFCSLFDETIGVPLTDDKNWCFKKGTSVLTPEGNKNIEDLKIGDKVISANDNSQQSITKIMKKESYDTAIIRIPGTFDTYTTLDHPYYTKTFKGYENKKLIYSMASFKPVSDIRPKDKVALHCHKFGPVSIDKKLAYATGVKMIKENEFNQDILLWNKESVKALLEGIYDTCSRKAGYNIKELKLKDLNIANNIVILLRGLEINPKCITKKESEYKYRIIIDLNSKESNCYFDKNNNVCWVTVVNNIKKQTPYEVYNLTVDKTHTFIANGALVHNCGGNGEMLAIGTDGRCYPCIRFMKYSLTNSKERSIGDIYNGLRNEDEDEFLKELCGVTMTTQSDDTCKSCKFASGCSLCTGYNYDYFGTPNKRATFICVMHKARVLANVYYFNKLYKEVGILNKFPCNINKEIATEIISEEEYLNIIK